MTGLTARASQRLEPLARAARRFAATPGRGARTAVVLGRILGSLVLVCFATGLYSHVLQHPPGWLALPTRPVGLYRVTQGVHVIAGLAMIPVLLGKLWAVYPRLFAWPPVTSVSSALERASIAVLVAAALLQVVLGAMNIAQWYVFPFSFRATHFASAWVLLGAMLVHIGVKLPDIRAHWRRAREGSGDEDADAGAGPAGGVEDGAGERTETLSRRGALAAVGTAAAVIVATTAGQTVAPLAPIAVLAPRRPGTGPQALPVNRTAGEAGVRATATAPTWRLTVASVAGIRSFTLAELQRLPQRTADLPIACVEGWSQTARWSGVPMADLLAAAGVPSDVAVRVSSLQTRGAFAVTTMPAEYVRDPLTLVALRLGGEPLDLDHGFPARVIAPGRPGVLQTKWLSRIEVLS